MGVDSALRRGQGSLQGREGYRGGELLTPGKHVGPVRDQRAAAAPGELPGPAAAAGALTILIPWPTTQDRRHFPEVTMYFTYLVTSRRVGWESFVRKVWM